MAHFTLKLLGPIQVAHDDQPVGGFRSQKALALLGYLATEGRPISRAYLAGLFWGEMGETQALGELRRTLHNLSQRMPDCLLVDRQTVQFAGEVCQADITTFSKLQAAADPAALAEAVDLYRGDFMEGVYLDDCPEVETWLLTERESRKQQQTHLLQTLVDYHANQGDLDPAINLCTRLLALEPWREESHRQLMLLLARDGRRHEALAQFESCRRILAEELAAEPSAETAALFERIKAADRTRPNNLPPQPTPFIGREKALAYLTATLPRSDCRLLTITGPGGMGKTRLALQTARALAQDKSGLFPHGVYFVPLEAASTTEALFPIIGEVLQFTFTAAERQSDQLFGYLADKEVLLLLDNFESLLAASSAAISLTYLLAAAPGLKLLVTSRQALNLRGEWIYPLVGMAVEQADEAAQLFATCAQRARPDFSLEADTEAVNRICHLTDGLPLALELAAGWLKSLSPAEVAAELTHGLDILATSQADTPERHRSLRAVFSTTWNHLSPVEQTTLAQLSVFTGGFTREAATQVAIDSTGGSGSLLLAELVDKSLLQVSGGVSPARYTFHSLLHQFAAEKFQHLPPDAQTEVRRLHSHYFAAMVYGQEAILRRAKRSEALTALGRELENIQTGWAWAIEHHEWPVVSQFSEALFLFFELRSRFEEGAQVFEQGCVGVKKQRGRGTERANLLPNLSSRWGWFCWRLGRYDKAAALAEEAFSTTGDEREKAFAAQLLGLVAYARGDFSAAMGRFQESLTLWQQTGDRWGAALALLNLGRVHQAMGQYQQVGGPLQEGLALMRETGYQVGATTAFGSLGGVVRNLGDLAKARELCAESLALHRAQENPWGVASALDSLGVIDCGLGQVDKARESFQISLAVRRELKDLRGMAATLTNLGRAAAMQGHQAEARRFCEQSLNLWRELGDRLGQAGTFFALGQIANASDSAEEARLYFRESVALYRSLGNRAGLAGALSGLGFTALSLADEAGAEVNFSEAWEISLAIEALPSALESLLGRAGLLARAGDMDSARRLMALVIHHPAASPELTEKAGQLLPALVAEIGQSSVGNVADLAALQTAVAEISR